jgi:hypothetical protein
MSTHKTKPIEELVQQIQETLEEKPDRDEVEHWSSELAFKLEQIHEDVLNLQSEVAEVGAQVDLLQS